MMKIQTMSRYPHYQSSITLLRPSKRTSHQNSLMNCKHDKIISSDKQDREASRHSFVNKGGTHFPSSRKLKDILHPMGHVKLKKIMDPEAAKIDSQSSGELQCPQIVEGSSLISLNTLLKRDEIEGKDTKTLNQPYVEAEQNDGEDCSSLFNSSDSLTSAYSVHIEEVKSYRRKTWRFPQTKTSERAIVMFPNPTFDQNTIDYATNIATLPRPFNEKSKGLSSVPDLNLKQMASIAETSLLVPLFSDFELKKEMVTVAEKSTAVSLLYIKEEVADDYDQMMEKSDQKLKEIVSVKPKPFPSRFGNADSGYQGTHTDSKFIKSARLKVPDWLRNLKKTSNSPTVIRRLPSFHEMEEIRSSNLTIPHDYK